MSGIKELTERQKANRLEKLLTRAESFHEGYRQAVKDILLIGWQRE